MLKDITIGQYYKADSFIHKLDPRTKIISTIILIVIIFLAKNFFSLALSALFALVSILVSRVPLKMYLKSLKPIIPILLFTAIINVFYIESGDVLLSYWKITITTGGVFTALFMGVRILLLIMCSSILTYTTVPTALTDGLEKLLSPLKLLHIDIASLAMMMTLALRFIPTLIEEIERITNAQKARGADLEGGSFIRKIKAMIPILIPLFVSSFNRAYELAFAMSCRCYSGGKGRTRMKVMRFSPRDLVCAFVFPAVTAGVIVLNVFFGSVI